jgi:hypothetical protein
VLPSPAAERQALARQRRRSDSEPARGHRLCGVRARSARHGGQSRAISAMAGNACSRHAATRTRHQPRAPPVPRTAEMLPLGERMQRDTSAPPRGVRAAAPVKPLVRRLPTTHRGHPGAAASTRSSNRDRAQGNLHVAADDHLEHLIRRRGWLERMVPGTPPQRWSRVNPWLRRDEARPGCTGCAVHLEHAAVPPQNPSRCHASGDFIQFHAVRPVLGPTSCWLTMRCS